MINKNLIITVNLNIDGNAMVEKMVNILVK